MKVYANKVKEFWPRSLMYQHDCNILCYFKTETVHYVVSQTDSGNEILKIALKQQLTLVCSHSYWQVKTTCFGDMYFLVWWIIWIEGGLYPGAMKVIKEIKCLLFNNDYLPYLFRVFLVLKHFYRTRAGKFQFRLVTFPPYQLDCLVAKKN